MDPVDVIRWGGTLPSRRRAVQSIALATLIGAAALNALVMHVWMPLCNYSSTMDSNLDLNAILNWSWQGLSCEIQLSGFSGWFKMHGFVCFFSAIGGNFGGLTSFLLSLDGGSLAAKLDADVLIPVKGYKRCVDRTFGFGKYLRCIWHSHMGFYLYDMDLTCHRVPVPCIVAGWPRSSAEGSRENRKRASPGSSSAHSTESLFIDWAHCCVWASRINVRWLWPEQVLTVQLHLVISCSTHACWLIQGSELNKGWFCFVVVRRMWA